MRRAVLAADAGAADPVGPAMHVDQRLRAGVVVQGVDVLGDE